MVPQCFSIKAESMQSSSQTGFKTSKYATAKSPESVESCILCTAKNAHGAMDHGGTQRPGKQMREDRMWS